MVVGGGRLYTLHNRGNRGQTGDQEVVVAVDTATGETVWEFAYKASFTNDAEVFLIFCRRLQQPNLRCYGAHARG